MKQAFLCAVCLLIASSCHYHRGDLFISKNAQQDTMIYVLAVKGSGDKIAEKAVNLKKQHEMKGNSCTVRYYTDSISLRDNDGVILFNSYLPEMKDDMLRKGYFGTFTSKQNVTYLLVSYDDLEKSFVKTRHKKKDTGF